MTENMYDGIGALAAGIARAFPGAPKIAGYVNGKFAWSYADWDHFPHADHVRISVTASANVGDVLDVEAGDASPNQTAGWIAMRKAAGLYRPTIYCSRDTIPAVRAGTGKYILARDYDIWVADYTGVPHQVTAPGIPHATCAATQYEATANWDVSVVYDPAWPHRTPPELPAPHGISVTLHGQLADFGWTAVASASSYVFQVFHYNSAGTFGDPVANKVVDGTHVEGLTLPGGGGYACRIRANDPRGIWSAWKIF